MSVQGGESLEETNLGAPSNDFGSEGRRETEGQTQTIDKTILRPLRERGPSKSKGIEKESKGYGGGGGPMTVSPLLASLSVSTSLLETVRTAKDDQGIVRRPERERTTSTVPRCRTGESRRSRWVPYLLSKTKGCTTKSFALCSLQSLFSFGVGRVEVTLRKNRGGVTKSFVLE